MNVRTITLSVSLATFALSAAPQSFERYRVILDKQLFGRPRPTVVPQAPPKAPPPPGVANWAKEFRVTLMLRDDNTGDVQVGLQNIKDYSGFLLRTGDRPEQNGGYKLIRADFEKQFAVVSFQGLEQSFTQAAGPVAASTSVTASGAVVVSPAASAPKNPMSRIEARNEFRARKRPTRRPTRTP